MKGTGGGYQSWLSLLLVLSRAILRRMLMITSSSIHREPSPSAQTRETTSANTWLSCCMFSESFFSFFPFIFNSPKK